MLTILGIKRTQKKNSRLGRTGNWVLKLATLTHKKECGEETITYEETNELEEAYIICM